jgi:hypothetical protein
MFDTFDDNNLSPFGEDTGGVLPDVSQSSPPEQPTTPTGTGSGYYVPSAWESGLLGGLSQALNYAIQRDQAQFAAQHGYAPGVAYMTPTPRAAAAMGNSRLLVIGGIVVLALVLMRK